MRSSRSATIANVGVCTRPTGVLKKPPSLLLKAVMARVPLMPTNQSASARERAACSNGFKASSLRKFVKASRIEVGVIDCSQSRLTGFLTPAYCKMYLKMSSPSRPASQALISSVTSFRLISLTSIFKRSVERLSLGTMSNCGGITGKLLKLHFPLTGSLGAIKLNRWPTLEDKTYWSLSK